MNTKQLNGGMINDNGGDVAAFFGLAFYDVLHILPTVITMIGEHSAAIIISQTPVTYIAAENNEAVNPW